MGAGAINASAYLRRPDGDPGRHHPPEWAVGEVCHLRWDQYVDVLGTHGVLPGCESVRHPERSKTGFAQPLHQVGFFFVPAHRRAPPERGQAERENFLHVIPCGGMGLAAGSHPHACRMPHGDAARVDAHQARSPAGRGLSRPCLRDAHALDAAQGMDAGPS